MGPYNNNNWASNYYQPNNMWPAYNQIPSQRQQHQQQQQPVNNVLRVTGPESAKAYSLPADSDIVLFDAQRPIFYFKSTDDSGFATNPRAFKFEEIDLADIQTYQQEQFNTSDFATKEDLANLKENISEIKQMLEGLVN